MKERRDGFVKPAKEQADVRPNGTQVIRVEDGRDIRDVSCIEACVHDVKQFCPSWITVLPLTVSAPVLAYWLASFLTDDPRLQIGAAVCAGASNVAPFIVVFFLDNQKKV